ncbi:hypothetical protein AKJ16_DCAP06127 [Drosera capensis]
MSKPLYVEAHTNLIGRRPISSKASQVPGSVIIVEFIVVLSLGVALLFYPCKCDISLVNERSRGVRKNTTPSIGTSEEHTPRNQSREKTSRKNVGAFSRTSGDQMQEASAKNFVGSLSIEKRRIGATD